MDFVVSFEVYISLRTILTIYRHHIRRKSSPLLSGATKTYLTKYSPNFCAVRWLAPHSSVEAGFSPPASDFTAIYTWTIMKFRTPTNSPIFFSTNPSYDPSSAGRFYVISALCVLALHSSTGWHSSPSTVSSRSNSISSNHPSRRHCQRSLICWIFPQSALPFVSSFAAERSSHRSDLTRC